MEDELLNERVIVRYLLGNLSEEEQARLEDRVFSDRILLDRVRAVEEDLIDDYVRGLLSERERRQFESRFFASNERRQKVEFSRALAQVTAEPELDERMRVAPVPTSTSWKQALAALLGGLSPAFRFSLAAAALVLLIGLSWLVVETIRLRSQLATLDSQQQALRRQEESLRQEAQSERERSEELAARLRDEQQQRERSEELTRQLQREREEAESSRLAVISLALLPGVSRGGGDRPTLVIPRNARLARLQVGLEREDDYASYRVELRTRSGQEIWSQERLRARTTRAGRVVTLYVTAGAIKPGEYELALKGLVEAQGFEDVRFYYFAVVNK